MINYFLANFHGVLIEIFELLKLIFWNDIPKYRYRSWNIQPYLLINNFNNKFFLIKILGVKKYCNQRRMISYLIFHFFNLLLFSSRTQWITFTFRFIFFFVYFIGRSWPDLLTVLIDVKYIFINIIIWWILNINLTFT